MTNETNDVLLNKIDTIRRCLIRLNEVYQGTEANLKDYTKQDSLVLNLQRACEAAIDLAMHIVARNHLGVPQTSREAFDLLLAKGIIDTDSAEKMKAMVGFHNIAVHDYQALQLPILKSILDRHLGDFERYIEQLIQASHS